MKMKRITDAPCKDCIDRHTNCHVSCELYSEYRKELDLYNKKVAEEHRLECVLDNFVKRRMRGGR